MAQKIKILDKRDFPSTNPQRVGKMDSLITYQIDPFHTYVVAIAKEDATENKIKEVIAADMKDREQWINKEIEL